MNVSQFYFVFSTLFDQSIFHQFVNNTLYFEDKIHSNKQQLVATVVHFVDYIKYLNDRLTLS